MKNISTGWAVIVLGIGIIVIGLVEHEGRAQQKAEADQATVQVNPDGSIGDYVDHGTILSDAKMSDAKMPDAKMLSRFSDGSNSTSVWLMHYSGHDYLVNRSGGIIHAESCKCKAK